MAADSTPRPDPEDAPLGIAREEVARTFSYDAARVIGLSDVHAACERIAGIAVRTPLVRLAVDGAPAEIYLKLENLQPIGSFKIRGASTLMTAADPNTLAAGVWTASAGNMAQGVAWNARRLGIPCTIVVPEAAPRTKLEGIERLGARTVPVPPPRSSRCSRRASTRGCQGSSSTPSAIRLSWPAMAR